MQNKDNQSIVSSNIKIGLGAEYIGKHVIIRTYSAGVWFGILDQKAEDEIILKEARRMWRWHTKKGISLSSVALYGITNESKIEPPVEQLWLQAIEIIPTTLEATHSIKNAEDAKPD